MRQLKLNTINGFKYEIMTYTLVVGGVSTTTSEVYVTIHDCFGYVKVFNEDTIDAMHFVNPDSQPIKVGYFKGGYGKTDVLYFIGKINCIN